MQLPSSSTSRRSFLTNIGMTAATLASGLPLNAASAARPKWPIIAFSKPFQHLSHEDCAALVEEIGWDGIECPVRPKGQIEPERAAEDLPALQQALSRRGKSILIATTSITSVEDPGAEALLRVLAKQGIRRYRMGYYRYDKARNPADELREIRPRLRDLAALNQELGIMGCYQNHSGDRYVGAPIWDLHELMEDLDPAHLGVFFDIGHATAEGGSSWPIEARLMRSRMGGVYVKDFQWARTAKGWKATWCGLGEGMVSSTFFGWLKQTGYDGLISQHHEYELGDEASMKQAFHRDLKALQAWL